MKTQTRNGRYVELLDTTLRDGEQTPGVAFTPAEKFEIARILISHLRIDRLEIGSARVSDGEREALAAILKWAEHRGCVDRMGILGFVDGGKSAAWIRDAGGKVLNLLAKGSENHCRVQLRKEPSSISTRSAARLRMRTNSDWTSISTWRTGPTGWRIHSIMSILS